MLNFRKSDDQARIFAVYHANTHTEDTFYRYQSLYLYHIMCLPSIVVYYIFIQIGKPSTVPMLPISCFTRSLSFDSSLQFPALNALQARWHSVFSTAQALDRGQSSSSSQARALRCYGGEIVPSLIPYLCYFLIPCSICCNACQPLRILLIGVPRQQTTSELIRTNNQLCKVHELFEIFDYFSSRGGCSVP